MDEVDKITQASLFGFSHRPDISLGNDGTALEIKVVGSGQGIRDVLGQALAYRMHYRFVILVVIDTTPERQIVNLCGARRSRECDLLSELSESLNIFTIVGPLGQSRNIVFAGQRQRREKTAAKTKSMAQVKAEQSAALDAGQPGIRKVGTSDQVAGPRK